MADYSDDHRYTAEHEWIAVGDGELGTVGITHHAQDELGDVVFIELPEPGQHFEAGATFGTIESVKAVSDLYAPVAGEVTEVHEELVDRPELVNEDPHGDGWMVRFKLDDPSDVEELMTAEAYQRHIEE